MRVLLRCTVLAAGLGLATSGVAAAGKPAQQASARSGRASRDASKPHYRVDAVTGSLVPDLRAEAAIIYDPQTGEILWEENAQDQRSIASITKVMTAMVLLESGRDPDETVLIARGDVQHASTTHLQAGERVTVDTLLHLILIPSDNGAARAIARTSPGGAAAFIQRMNEKALELGLLSTSYDDPSGLSSGNISSAYEMARLISFAGTDARIASIMQLPEYAFRTSRRRVTVRNTNQLVRQGEPNVLIGKTGFIRKAGYCLATLLRLPEGGSEIAVVVLGAQSSAIRFWETRHLFNWFAQNARSLFSTAIPPDN